ncbi:MAG: hypothetical protein COA78_27815 [Blastopirellula sp.]|nr:MAG: hypothetical protein COA78_27815 [Blastopirellula sp.]
MRKANNRSAVDLVVTRENAMKQLVLIGLIMTCVASEAFCKIGDDLTPQVAERPFAIVNLDGAFQSHMVLQRDMSVPVWGITQPGVEVTVAFAGQTKTAKGANDGHWQVKLDPISPSFKGQRLTVIGGGHTITLEDILVGDVWICAGQSNMAMSLAPMDSPEAAKELNVPMRLDGLRICSKLAMNRQPDLGRVEAFWWPFNVANSNEYRISKTGFYFARKLIEEQKTPVGVYYVAFGGTSMFQWIDKSNLPKTKPLDTEYVDSIYEVAATPMKGYDAYVSTMNRMVSKLDDQIARSQDPKVNSGQRSIAKERVLDIQAYMRDKAAVERIKKDHPGWTAFPPKPVFVPRSIYQQKVKPWKRMAIRGVLWYQGEADGNQGYSYAKLMPIFINQWRTDFAKDGQVLPFIQVEIPPVNGYTAGMEFLREAQVASVKDAGLEKVGLVVTNDLGPTEEGGDGLGVHSAPKQPIGERAAMVADVIEYSGKGSFWGPTFKSVKFDGPKAIVALDNAQGLRTSDGKNVPHEILVGVTEKDPEGKKFYPIQLAGEDRLFHPAKAQIVGETLVITSEAVKQPVAVRVGFDNYMPTNIANASGLPIAGFRSDRWKSANDGKNAPGLAILRWNIAVDGSEVAFVDENSRAPQVEAGKKKGRKPKAPPAWVSTSGVINAGEILKTHQSKGKTYSATATVHVQADTKAILWVGSTNTFVISVNGQKVRTQKYEKPSKKFTPAEYAIFVELKSGDNSIQLQSDLSAGNGEFAASVSDPNDVSLPGLAVTSSKSGN